MASLAPLAHRAPKAEQKRQTLTKAKPQPELQRSADLHPPPLFTRPKIRLPSAEPIQAKLTVSEPDDQFEKEADRVAEQVMRMPDAAAAATPPNAESGSAGTKNDGAPTRQRRSALRMRPVAQPARAAASGPQGGEVQRAESETLDEQEDAPGTVLERSAVLGGGEERRGAGGESTPVRIQRKCETCSAELDEDTKVQRAPLGTRRTPDSASAPSFAHSLREARESGGRPLPNGIRQFMEPRFGQDFGQVRVHTDARADRLSRGIGARAFTTGHDIFFRPAEFRPNAAEGRTLIAHELTHVVQQATVKPRAGVQRAVTVEDAADQMADLEFQLTEEFTVENAFGNTKLERGATVKIIVWDNTKPSALVSSKLVRLPEFFEVPKRLLTRKRLQKRIHPYSAGVRTQAAAVKRSEAALRRSTVERFPTLDKLLKADQFKLNRKIIQETMFNRFDSIIVSEVDKANKAYGLTGKSALDPNLLKSMLFQESELGTGAGEHLDHPADRELKSRFNISQTIDSSGNALLLMLEDKRLGIAGAMGASLISKYHLQNMRTELRANQQALDHLLKQPKLNHDDEVKLARLKRLADFNEQKQRGIWETFFWSYPGFYGAIVEFFNSTVPAKHLDYEFWIQMMVLWLFQKKIKTGRTWEQAIKAYNGGEAYRDAVLKRAKGAADAEKINGAFFPTRKGGVVQRKTDGTSALSPDRDFTERLDEARASGGKQLPESLRRFMEPRFGRNFGAVRVHTDARADSLSRGIGARAFTTGRDIFFRPAEFRPHVAEGRSLIAHELTHVVQQRGGPGAGPLAAHSAVSETSPTPGACESPPSHALSIQRKVKVDPAGEVGDVLGQFQSLCAAGNFSSSGGQIVSACTASTTKSCECLCDVADDPTRTYTIKVRNLVEVPEVQVLADGTTATVPTPSVGPSTQVGRNPIINMPSSSSTTFSFGVFDPSGSPIFNAPNTRILAHELCGHARLVQVQGGARGGRPGHDATIQVENEIAAEQGEPTRGKFINPRQGESFSQKSGDPKVAFKLLDGNHFEVPAPLVAPAALEPRPFDIFFNKNRPFPGETSATLTSAATLDGNSNFRSLVETLKRNPTLLVEIIGHASPEGTLEANFRVGERRARVLADALVRAGIDRARFQDKPGLSLDPACRDIATGVHNCGEIGATGDLDRRVRAEVFTP